MAHNSAYPFDIYIDKPKQFPTLLSIGNKTLSINNSGGVFLKPCYESKKFCLVFSMGMLIFALAGYSESATRIQSQLQGYPIDTNVFTTLQRTVVPIPVPSSSSNLFPYQVSSYDQYGYGKWQYGPGTNCVKRLDIMATNYSGASVANTARLLKFFTITDIHIADKESPVQAIFAVYNGGSASASTISAYSPIMLYTTHVLDAAIQTINALHRQNPFDLGISLGDTCNDTQLNELRWYIDVLDGQDINPDSGIKDDPVPGPYNDYQDEYKAAGLDQTIPWYQAIGNHDHFLIGANIQNDYTRQAYTNQYILNLGDLTDPNYINEHGYYMGALNGTTFYGDLLPGLGLTNDIIPGIGPTNLFTEPPMVLAADPNRRSLARKEWISEFFDTTSLPIGHGFSQTNVTTGFACYAFEPKSNLPLKVIVLDDTQGDSDPNDGGYAHGALDTNRYAWLVSELDKGQAEGKLMIIAAHAPIGVSAGSPGTGWSTNSLITCISETNLIAKLNTYPNLILWIAGHRHFNAITAMPSPDPAHPEFGFWEVETSSLRDYPQQFRTFEIVCNSDNTVSIIATDVDPSVKEGSLAAISRSYAVAAQEIFNVQIGRLPTGSYNAELVKQLTPEMQAKLSGSRQTQTDYDGDGKADPTLYDETTGTWRVKLSSANYTQMLTTLNGLGGPGAASVGADYDGDQKADPTVYYEQTGRWAIMLSSANYEVVVVLAQTLGGAGYSGMPADYDGDGKADPAVYQRERGDWKVLFSSANYNPVEVLGLLGGTGYSAVAADYDGDGKADPAVYGEGTGDWKIMLSGSNYSTLTLANFLGGSGYIPFPADYDGDGLADPAVKSTIGNEWIVMFSSGGYTPVHLTIPFE